MIKQDEIQIGKDMSLVSEVYFMKICKGQCKNQSFVASTNNSNKHVNYIGFHKCMYCFQILLASHVNVPI